MSTEIKATRFMSKPFFVVGHLVTQENMETVAAWCEGTVIKNPHRPFIRVPVQNPKTKKHSEAYVGFWVLQSMQRDEPSFKVYNLEWLEKNFIPLPDFEMEFPPQAIAPLLVCERIHTDAAPRSPVPSQSSSVFRVVGQ